MKWTKRTTTWLTYWVDESGHIEIEKQSANRNCTTQDGYIYNLCVNGYDKGNYRLLADAKRDGLKFLAEDKEQ